MLEKAAFFQSELGISAGLFPLTWKCAQAMKDGSAVAPRHKIRILSTDLIREGLALNMLIPG